MTEPEKLPLAKIEPCPVCGHRCVLDFDGGHGDGLPFPKGYGAVRCLKVPQHYQGPTVESHVEAIRLHNALRSPDKPEAEAAQCPRCDKLHHAYEVANEHLSIALEVISKQLKERSA